MSLACYDLNVAHIVPFELLADRLSGLCLDPGNLTDFFKFDHVVLNIDDLGLEFKGYLVQVYLLQRLLIVTLLADVLHDLPQSFVELGHLVRETVMVLGQVLLLHL